MNYIKLIHKLILGVFYMNEYNNCLYKFYPKVNGKMRQICHRMIKMTVL